MAKRKHPLRELRRVIAYIRVSLERGQMDSPDIQMAAMKRHFAGLPLTSEGKPVEIVEVVIDLDETGTTFDNRKVEYIVGQIRDDKADGVAVLNTSRWGRNAELTKRYRREIEELSGHYVPINLNFAPDDPNKEFFLGVHELLDEKYAKDVGKAWQDAHTTRREKRGLPHTGKLRFGYRRCGDCKPDLKSKKSEKTGRHRAYAFCTTCEGILQPDEKTAETLAEAYRRWVEDDDSFNDIAEDARVAGIRSVNGNIMSASNWRDTMDTGFAAGLIRHDTGDNGSRNPWDWEKWSTGKHKALITMDLWKRYAAKRKKQSQPGTRTQTAKFVVSGMMRCGVPRLRPNEKRELEMQACLSSMGGGVKSRRGLVSFNCLHNKEKKGCTGVQITLSMVEVHVKAWLTAHAKDDHKALETMQRCATDGGRDLRALAALEAQRAELSKQQEILVDELLKGDNSAFPKAVLEKKSATVKTDLALLEERISVLQDKAASGTVPPPEKFAGLLAAWPKMTIKEQRLALSQVIDHIVVVKTPGKNRNFIEIVPRWAPAAMKIKRRIDLDALERKRAELEKAA